MVVGWTPRTGGWLGLLPRDALEVQRVDANDAAARAIDVGDEEERNRHQQRKDDEPSCVAFRASRSVAEQIAARDGDRRHENPRRHRDAVPPGGLSVRL